MAGSRGHTAAKSQSSLDPLINGIVQIFLERSLRVDVRVLRYMLGWPRFPLHIIRVLRQVALHPLFQFDPEYVMLRV